MTQPLHPDTPGGGSASSAAGGTSDPLTDPLAPTTSDEFGTPGDDVLTSGATGATGATGSAATYSTTGTGGGSGSSGSSSTTDVAKDKAGEVTQSAKEAGAQVAGTAKEQAGQVASEAKNQAKDLLARSRGELQDQASQQQQRAAQGLRTLGDQLGQMAENAQDDGLARDLARQVADRASGAASWLEHRDPGSLLEEVRGFARQRPMAFLALSAGAGLLVARLGRGVQAASSDSSGGQGTGGTLATTGGTYGGTAPGYMTGPGYASGSDVDLTATETGLSGDAGYGTGDDALSAGSGTSRPFPAGSDTGGRP